VYISSNGCIRHLLSLHVYEVKQAAGQPSYRTSVAIGNLNPDKRYPAYAGCAAIGTRPIRPASA
jgi:hypothetical protein